MNNISVYTSAFNVVKMRYNWKAALENYLSIADEIVIAINTSEDDTKELLEKYAETNSKIKLVLTNIGYDNPRLDGLVKEAALRGCIFPYVIQMDLDERFIPNSQDLWVQATKDLENKVDIRGNKVDAFVVPSLDLWGDLEHIRYDKDHNARWKWRIHKNLQTLHRGVVNFARREDGTHDITKSDSTELIYDDGSLVNAIPYFERFHTLEEYIGLLNKYPFTFHLGHVDFRDKIYRNNTFWRKMWSIESGEQKTLPEEEYEYFKTTFPHELDINFLKPEYPELYEKKI